jgi:tetratricopeptide (TPR) repeat protein
MAQELVSSSKTESDRIMHNAWVAFVESYTGQLNIIHGNPNAALEQLQAASDTLDQDTTETPGNTWYEYILGRSRFQRGLALTQLGRWEEAISAHEEAQRHWRSTGFQLFLDYAALSQSLVGELNYALGRRDEGDIHLSAALNQFNATVDALPEEPNANHALVVFLCMCPNPQMRDPERAVRLAERFISGSDSNPLFWRYLALARYRIGDWPGAEEAVRNSIELLNGGDALDLLLLAAIEHSAGDVEEARSTLAQAHSALAAGSPILYDCIDPHRFARFRAEVETLLGQPAEESVAHP